MSGACRWGSLRATLQSRPAFLQGKIPRATSLKDPVVQARAVLGGRSRPTRFSDPLPRGIQPDSLTPCQVRGCRDATVARGPRPRCAGEQSTLRHHSPRNARKCTMMASAVAFCFHAQYALWPAQGSVPIFDMTEFRDPYLCKAYP